MSKTIYLGKRVKDVGKKGLDRASEVEGICKAIISDYKRGKIDYKTAMARLNFLQTTVIPRDKKMSSTEKKRALSIVRKYKKRLQSLKTRTRKHTGEKKKTTHRGKRKKKSSRKKRKK